MCKSQADGGQRCSAHTKAALHRAEEDLADATATRDRLRATPGPISAETRAQFASAVAEVDRARTALHDAMVAHASTTAGRRDYEAQLEQARAATSQICEQPDSTSAQFAAAVDEEVRLTGILDRGAALRATNDRLAHHNKICRTGTPITAQQADAALTGTTVTVTRHRIGTTAPSGPAQLVGVTAHTIHWTQGGLHHTALLGTSVYRHDENQYTLIDETGPTFTFTRLD